MFEVEFANAINNSFSFIFSVYIVLDKTAVEALSNVCNRKSCDVNSQNLNKRNNVLRQWMRSYHLKQKVLVLRLMSLVHREKQTKRRVL